MVSTATANSVITSHENNPQHYQDYSVSASLSPLPSILDFHPENPDEAPQFFDDSYHNNLQQWSFHPNPHNLQGAEMLNPDFIPFKQEPQEQPQHRQQQPSNPNPVVQQPTPCIPDMVKSGNFDFSLLTLPSIHKGNRKKNSPNKNNNTNSSSSATQCA